MVFCFSVLDARRVQLLVFCYLGLSGCLVQRVLRCCLDLDVSRVEFVIIYCLGLDVKWGFPIILFRSYVPCSLFRSVSCVSHCVLVPCIHYIIVFSF